MRMRQGWRSRAALACLFVALLLGLVAGCIERRPRPVPEFTVLEAWFAEGLLYVRARLGNSGDAGYSNVRRLGVIIGYSRYPRADYPLIAHRVFESVSHEAVHPGKSVEVVLGFPRAMYETEIPEGEQVYILFGSADFRAASYDVL